MVNPIKALPQISGVTGCILDTSNDEGKQWFTRTFNNFVCQGRCIETCSETSQKTGNKNVQLAKESELKI